MKNFLKQNWVWIVVPLLFMAIAIYVLVQGLGEGSSSDTGYPIF